MKRHCNDSQQKTCSVGARLELVRLGSTVKSILTYFPAGNRFTVQVLEKYQFEILRLLFLSEELNLLSQTSVGVQEAYTLSEKFQ